MCTSPALIGLGLVPPPGQEEPEVDLALARHFIDLLALLDEKTGDNLSDEEQQAVEQSLHELRMAFVQVQTAVAATPDDVADDEPSTAPSSSSAETAATGSSEHSDETAPPDESDPGDEADAHGTDDTESD